jgi:hypothetical protein
LCDDPPSPIGPHPNRKSVHAHALNGLRGAPFEALLNDFELHWLQWAFFDSSDLSDTAVVYSFFDRCDENFGS